MTNKKSSPKKLPNNYARLSGLAIQMFAIIGIGTFVGVKLDEKYPNEHKLFTIIFLLASVIISILVVVRTIISSSKEENK